MGGIWQRFLDMWQATEIPQQILGHNILGLAYNLWFMIPLGLFLLWRLYRKDWRGITLVAVAIGLWWFSGSEFMEGITVDGKPVLGKVLSVIGVFVAAVGIIAYLLLL
jgi:hypothetical protein